MRKGMRILSYNKILKNHIFLKVDSVQDPVYLLDIRQAHWLS